MADIDTHAYKLPNDNNTYLFKDKQARDNMADTSDTNALNHLGFYLDSNGGLCQVNSIGE